MIRDQVTNDSDLNNVEQIKSLHNYSRFKQLERIQLNATISDFDR